MWCFLPSSQRIKAAVREATSEGETDPGASPLASSDRGSGSSPGRHWASLHQRAKIQIKNLDFFYGEVQALKGINLNVPGKQVTAVIGPSGCGKSTLLRVLNRMYDMYPSERVTGDVQLDGRDILARMST